MKPTQATDFGTLYIVATPIGNKDDISLRAINTLKSVDFILAEDTRHSYPLLNLLGIKKTLIALHAHNEQDKSQEIINQLLRGSSIALISDAGTPLISDPGFPLVKLAREHHIPVVPIPGACALITALSASGIPCDSFLFSSFLPSKQQARVNKLNALLGLAHTVILYESTHRLVESLQDIAAVYGEEHHMVLAKELTKTFEQFIPGSVLEIQKKLIAEPVLCKGEFVLIIPAKSETKDSHEEEHLLRILLNEVPLKQAVSIACQLTKGNKNDLYELALTLKNT